MVFRVQGSALWRRRLPLCLLLMNRAGLCPWDHQESGRTLVLRSFWLCSGSGWGGRAGAARRLAVPGGCEDEAGSKRRRLPAC